MNDLNGGEISQPAEELALRFLQGTGIAEVEEPVEEEPDDEPEDSGTPEFSGHPAWKTILDAVPAEYHDKVLPTLQEWDAGVSRRFQKIHDEYEPYKEFEQYDPNNLKQAADLYTALVNDPAATWETIGKVFGLSPEDLSQSVSSEDDEDFDYSELPPSVKAKLAKIDEHDRALEMMQKEQYARQQSQTEAEEDAALDAYISELHEQYGGFDEEYVVSLIASGYDGEEAVERFYSLIETASKASNPTPAAPKQSAPRIMSGSGGVPTPEIPDTSKMSNQDTQSLVAEILKLAANE